MRDIETTYLRPSRRGMLLGTAGLVGGGLMLAGGTASAAERVVKSGRLKQSVCKWCYRMSVEELAAASKEMGLVGIDLLTPQDFPTIKEHGLVCTMTSSHGITEGLNHPDHQDACLKQIRDAIEATAAEGWRNVICFSGNRRGMDDETGLANCTAALKKIVGLAEEKDVVINMELLNSRVDHADYMCDRSAWGIELVKRVGSPNFKLLYDIYHMQIMEGDIIRSIRDNHQYFGHYHTAGNPGRHELDDSQELNYAPISQAIVETGFDGYMAQEFIPTRDPLASLAEAVAVCDV
jgi:hydroxypyruvate isomerase